jgi:hypothetical protein
LATCLALSRRWFQGRAGNAPETIEKGIVRLPANMALQNPVRRKILAQQRNLNQVFVLVVFLVPDGFAQEPLAAKPQALLLKCDRFII